MTNENSKNTFIPNPCIKGDDSPPMVILSTGLKDYIGGHGGFYVDEEGDQTGEVVLEYPMLYVDTLQQLAPNIPPQVVKRMQPVYFTLGAIKMILVEPVTTYFLKSDRGEDQQTASQYQDILEQFLYPNVAKPTDEVRKLTLAPK